MDQQYIGRMWTGKTFFSDTGEIRRNRRKSLKRDFDSTDLSSWTRNAIACWVSYATVYIRRKMSRAYLVYRNNLRTVAGQDRAAAAWPGVLGHIGECMTPGRHFCWLENLVRKFPLRWAQRLEESCPADPGVSILTFLSLQITPLRMWWMLQSIFSEKKNKNKNAHTQTQNMLPTISRDLCVSASASKTPCQGD